MGMIKVRAKAHPQDEPNSPVGTIQKAGPIGNSGVSGKTPHQIYQFEEFEIPDEEVPHKDKDGNKLISFSYGRNSEKGGQVTELERRQMLLTRNAFPGITEKAKAAFLKYLHFSPAWMELVEKDDKKKETAPSTVQLPDLSKVEDKNLNKVIATIKDVKVIEGLLEKENAAADPRENVLNLLTARQRTLYGQ